MECSNSKLINRVFTRNTLKELIDMGESVAYTAAIQRYVFNASKRSHLECISEIYSFLKSQYQNEYYYKNTLINKLLLGIHNPHTTTALTEISVGNSKADFVLMNGKTVVYEIKTDLDNFDRLDGQIEDYYKAFSRVVVVTSERNFEEISRRLNDTPVGITILTKRGTLSVRKRPIEYTEKLSSTVMFKILRKYEYEELLRVRFKTLPSTSQFEYYRECLAWFNSIPILEAYEMFIQILKKRYSIEMDEFEKVPYELKFLVYFSDLKKADYSKLSDFLYA